MNNHSVTARTGKKSDGKDRTGKNEPANDGSEETSMQGIVSREPGRTVLQFTKGEIGIQASGGRVTVVGSIHASPISKDRVFDGFVARYLPA
jgi:hypothetical protein